MSGLDQLSSGLEKKLKREAKWVGFGIVASMYALVVFAYVDISLLVTGEEPLLSPWRENHYLRVGLYGLTGLVGVAFSLWTAYRTWNRLVRLLMTLYAAALLSQMVCWWLEQGSRIPTALNRNLAILRLAIYALVGISAWWSIKTLKRGE